MKGSSMKNQRWLVFATWGLVLVSLISMFVVKSKMAEQVEAMRYATELQWRPFLKSELIRIESGYKPSEETNEDPKDTLKFAVNFGEMTLAELLNIDLIQFQPLQTRIVTNTGYSPLYIKASILSFLYEDEWEKYNKDPIEFAKAIRAFDEWTLGKIENDIVLFPNDTGSVTGGFKRSMEKDKFSHYLSSKDTMNMYYYFFIEYSDIFGHEYNLLFMDRMNATIVEHDEGVILVGHSGRPEFIRWDLELE